MKKNCEIEELNNEINRQSACVAQNTKLHEENKILKKAVGIQEGRLRELNQQNCNLQSILTNAADYVSQLENTITSLRIQLEGCSAKDFVMFPRPPDVF